jgi:hypothetical protein
MERKVYLVQLDDDKYGWSYLWHHTIKEINKISLKVEIVAMLLPILAVTTAGEGLDLLQAIDGVKTVEENSEGYFPVMKEE